MPGQATRYTTAQRTALVTAVLDEGKSQLEAIRLAAEGELAGLKPFGPVARGTLQGYLRQAMKHRKREIQTNAEELRAKLLAEIWEEVELTIPTLRGAEKIARIRQTASAIDALERKPNRAGRPPKEDPTNGKPDQAKPDEGEDLKAPSLDRLRKAAKATAQPDPQEKTADTGTAQPVVAPEPEAHDGQAERRAEGGVIGHERSAPELSPDQAMATVSA